MLDYRPIIQHLGNENSHRIDVLRLDLIHPQISGNKWFKLKLNLEAAKALGHTTILTFGGAYSNHIAATAAACNLAGFKSIGVIRGDKILPLNETLSQAVSSGMELEFVSRSDYKMKTEVHFLERMKEKFGDFYLIPEGGHNFEGILGCRGIIKPEWNYDYIFCACGTGTTFAGLVLCAGSAIVVGVSVLKGENTLPHDITNDLSKYFDWKDCIIGDNAELENKVIQNHCIIDRYAFSGYAAFDKSLISFKQEFEAIHSLALDYVYTNKSFFAVYDLIKCGKLRSDSKILILHCGGLQGNRSFEQRYHFNSTL